MTTVCILAFNSTILLSSQQQGSSNVVYIIQDTIIQSTDDLLTDIVEICAFCEAHNICVHVM